MYFRSENKKNQENISEVFQVTSYLAKLVSLKSDAWVKSYDFFLNACSNRHVLPELCFSCRFVLQAVHLPDGQVSKRRFVSRTSCVRKPRTRGLSYNSEESPLPERG